MPQYGVDLDATWNVFIDPNPPKRALNASQIFLGSFATIKEFWEFWKSIEVVLEKLPPNSNLRVCKENEEMDWAMFHIPLSFRHNVRELWLKALVATIAGKFPHAIGVVLSLRDSASRISIVCKSADDLRALIKNVLSLDAMDDVLIEASPNEIPASLNGQEGLNYNDDYIYFQRLSALRSWKFVPRYQSLIGRIFMINLYF